MWAYTNTSSLNCVKVDEVSKTLPANLRSLLFNFMANCSTMKERILSGSLSAPNLPVPIVRKDCEQYVGKLRFQKITQEKTLCS